MLCMPQVVARPAFWQCVCEECMVSLLINWIRKRHADYLLQVFSIREAATANLQRLAREFGPDWAKEHLVPQVR